MAEEFQFAFNLKQIEALNTALERCGVNGKDFKSLLEYFRDPELISAAKAAHARLRSKGQSYNRDKSTSEPIRELQKSTPLEELRKAHSALRADYMELLAQTGDLLKASKVAQTLLAKKLEIQRGAEDQQALEALNDALVRINLTESALAGKLTAMEVSA